jgi:poly(A) polymerase/tRNA nucleotidyltransferase (CCA-adding enzyme)
MRRILSGAQPLKFSLTWRGICVIEYPGLATIWDALPEARVVGGAVRDNLASLPVADIDLASPLSPEAVIDRLNAQGIKTIPTGIAHGTICAIASGRPFEITTLRRDIATDGRHATVAFTDDWQTDAARRDFTMNAMSMNRDGVLFDYFNGANDLTAGIVRFVGDAGTRIVEDYLRILRYFRFFARYGTSAPEASAIAAIEELRDGVLLLSAERVWSELKRILLAPDPVAALYLMQTTGVLERIIPEGYSIHALAALIARHAPIDALLRVAALLRGDVVSFAQRLKISNVELETLTAIRQPNQLSPDASDADLRRASADADTETLIARSWLGQSETGEWNNLRARLGATPRPVFPLQGRDLTALGIPPGPRIGKILSAVRAWWLETGCVADHASCRDRALIITVK